MKYSDLDKSKKAFIFELDDVLYPAKDYYYQVYYLFAALLEYTELFDAKKATDLMVQTYNAEGPAVVFDRLCEKFHVNELYRGRFNELLNTARLPLKLLLFKNMLTLLQDIVVERNKIFIVTNGDPRQQLNKIKQTEWNGLERYLTVYFADEIAPKPRPDTILRLLSEHQLQKSDMLMIGASDTDSFCAEIGGLDYLNAKDFLVQD